MNFFLDKIFSKRWMPLSVIAGLGFVLYFQTLFFGFTYLDDNTLILDNTLFLSKLSNIFEAFRTDVFHLFNHSAFYYRPMLTLSFMLDYQIGGVTPFIYHLTGIILHIAASYLVFVFLKRLNYPREISFLASLVFLVHPVMAQAVAWIPGRNDSLVTVFVLASFIYFIDFLKNFRKKDLIFHLIFFLLAIFTKETALFALFAFLFYAYFIRENRKNIFSKKYFFVGWGIILVLWFFLRQWALRGSSPIDFENMLKSVFFNSPATVQFLGKIIFPFNLSVLPIIQDTTFIYGAFALIFLTILFFLTKNKRWEYIVFGFVWFALFLFPSFIRPNSVLAADFIEHRLYLPLVGFFIIFLELKLVKKFRLADPFHSASVLFLIVFFCVLTVTHSRNFRDRLSFWESAAENSPHYPLAHRNLGAMRYLEGDLFRAEEEFKKALALNPNEEMAHNNLGLVYASQNKFEAAEEEYKKEIEINPYYDSVYFNFGLLYYKEKKFDEAALYWKKTLEINPGYLSALYNLAGLYYEQKDYKNAALFAGEINKKGLSLPAELSRLLEPLSLMNIEKDK